MKLIDICGPQACASNLGQPERSGRTGRRGPGGKALQGLAPRITGASGAYRGRYERLRRPRLAAQDQRMAFNTVIKACAKAADLETAEAYYARLLEEGLVPNKETFGKLSEAEPC